MIRLIWHNIIVILLSFLIVLNSLLLLCILTNSEVEVYFSQLELVKHLKQLYYNSNNGFSFVHVMSSLGASISFLIWHLRNQAMTEQTKSQYEMFNEDKQFSNFLEATRLLTDKDSTTEAKIAAMFSLADVAKDHPNHLDRIIQVLNKELSPLIKAIEGKGNANKYTLVLKEKEVTKKPFALRKKTELFSYTQNKIVSFGKSREIRENIKNWQHKGNETEKIVSVTLYVIRKIILDLDIFDSKFDFSNTIFFDIDTDFDKKRIGKKFIRKGHKRIENAMFLDCKLKNVNFREVNYHFCKFINCDLKEADFSDANLWGASFENCNFKDVKFKDAECECVEFKNCKNLTIEQLDKMKFKNLCKIQKHFTNSDENTKEKPKYLLIIDQSTLDNIQSKSLFLDNFLISDEYAEWKNSDKS